MALGWRMICFSLLFCLFGYFPGGYLSSITNVAQDVIYNFLNQSLIKTYQIKDNTNNLNALFSCYVALFNLGEFLGVLISAPIADRLGRKVAVFVVGSCFMIVGSIFTYLSKVYYRLELLILGRFLSGVHFGIARPVVYIYVMECVFPRYRGVVGVFGRLTIGIGMIIGQLLGLPEILGSNSKWPILIAVIPGALALLSILLTPFQPESPKFLRVIKNDRQGSIRNAKRLYRNELVAQRLCQLIEEEESMKKPVPLLEIFANSVYRRCATLSIILNIIRTIFGVTSFVITFSTFIFQQLHINLFLSQVLSIACISIGELATIVAVPFVYYFKRRTLFFISGWATVFIFVLVAIFGAIHRQWSNYLCCALIILATAVYSVGAASVSHIVATEILPLEIRASISAIGMALSMLSTSLIRIILFNIYTRINTLTYLITVVMSIASLIYLYIRMPETKDKQVIEIVSEIAGKSPMELLENGSYYGALDDDMTSHSNNRRRLQRQNQERNIFDDRLSDIDGSEQENDVFSPLKTRNKALSRSIFSYLTDASF